MARVTGSPANASVLAICIAVIAVLVFSLAGTGWGIVCGCPLFVVVAMLLYGAHDLRKYPY